ncbi:redoxin domain-containing protein [Portibacter marinus]|uniref:redoxin domain-containing protein n=1 Tax=Portibacter marinus TaxID=2898660 RepID=UPI001F179B0C|nr:redoxin domain-containing protein [Portibacter marinus]
MTINKGDKAPDFTLHSSDRKKVSLSDHRGKNVVLLFFPLAFTGVCTAELCSVRDDMSEYEALDAEVFGISIDTVMVLDKFKEEQGYNFTLLSDFNKEVCRSYGSYYDEFVLGMKGVAKRSAFVIDKEGVIKYAEVLDNAGEQPDFEAVKSTLNDLN